MVDDGTGNDFVHCFDGTVVDFKEKGEFDVGCVAMCTKLPLVLVDWGPVHKSDPSWVPLDPRMYNNEKKTHGWNLLKPEYVHWCELQAQCM